MDEALASVAMLGWVTASRLMPVSEFSMTCGVLVPMDHDLMEEVIEERLGWVRRSNMARLPNDPRFAAAIYRTSLEHGAMARVRYRALDEPLPLSTASAA